MKPNKFKIAGLILAVILLAAAIICKFALVGSDASAAKISLPLLASGLWAIMVFDTLAYKSTEAEGIQKKLELSRLIGGYLVTAFVTVAIVILLVSGGAK